jgi:hypothetical protein
MNQTIYLDCIREIVHSQMAIIGPMAVEQANNSQCIVVDKSLKDIKIIGDEKQAINKLISVYSELFGKISVEVSHDAIQKALKNNNVQDQVTSIIE